MGTDIEHPPFSTHFRARKFKCSGSVMDSILHQLSLGTLSESFSNERIDPGVALYMSDSALTDLGVHTIDDRIGLRELCTKYVSN